MVVKKQPRHSQIFTVGIQTAVTHMRASLARLSLIRGVLLFGGIQKIAPGKCRQSVTEEGSATNGQTVPCHSLGLRDQHRQNNLPCRPLCRSRPSLNSRIFSPLLCVEAAAQRHSLICPVLRLGKGGNLC